MVFVMYRLDPVFEAVVEDIFEMHRRRTPGIYSPA